MKLVELLHREWGGRWNATYDYVAQDDCGSVFSFTDYPFYCQFSGEWKCGEEANYELCLDELASDYEVVCVTRSEFIAYGNRKTSNPVVSKEHKPVTEKVSFDNLITIVRSAQERINAIIREKEDALRVLNENGIILEEFEENTRPVYGIGTLG